MQLVRDTVLLISPYSSGLKRLRILMGYREAIPPPMDLILSTSERYSPPCPP